MYRQVLYYVFPRFYTRTFVEWLDRIRSERKCEQAKNESKREYWRAVERSRINARRRELSKQLAEKQENSEVSR